MYLTPRRLDIQIERIDKALRILWRLYSPLRRHRVRVVKASYDLVRALEELEKLREDIIRDFETTTKIKHKPPGFVKD